MVDCSICGQSFKHSGALSGHVRFGHKVDWNNYKAGKYNQPSPTPPPPVQPPPIVQPQTPQPVVTQPQTPPPPTPAAQPSAVQGLSESNLENIAEKLYRKFQGETFKRLPQGVTPMEGLQSVEVEGEKINYKIALSPDVFWRWNVFKGQNRRLAGMGQAQLFEGDFSDFLDLATKTMLSTYGMYPTVMTFTGGKMLVEMPVKMEEQ